MTNRMLALLARAVTVAWVGSLWTTGLIVAPTLFSVLPDTAQAGLVAGRLFTVEAVFSLVCAPLLFLLWRRLYPDLHRWPRLVLASMWGLAVAGEWWLRPMMQAARAGTDGTVASFAVLHGVASIMYFGVAAGGVALLFAPVWGDPKD